MLRIFLDGSETIYDRFSKRDSSGKQTHAAMAVFVDDVIRKLNMAGKR